MKLDGASVLITGGAGFIGSHIADRLVEAGCARVVCLDNLIRGSRDNLSTALASGRVELVEGDIRDRELVSRLVAEADLVYHEAALRITHCAAEPRAAMEIMGQATYDLFERCCAAGVRKVVYASSASIYGLAETFPTPESQNPYDNRTLYGALKSFGEGVLRSFHDMYGLNYVALRYFNVYGPRMDMHGKYTEVLVRWMERISEGKGPVIFGDGQQTMDCVNVRDVARANVLAAASDATDRAYNVASGAETSLRGLARALSAVMGRPDLRPLHEGERAINPVPRRLADVSRARDELGFTASVSLEEGLAELVEWWKSQRSAMGVMEGAAE